MVPTNRTHVWFGWVAQGWNITHFPLILSVWFGSCRDCVGVMVGIGRTRCWVLEPQVVSTGTDPTQRQQQCWCWLGW